MKSRTTIILIPLVLLFSAAPMLRTSAVEDPETMIRRAAAVFETPGFTTEAVARALGEILDAALLILPKTDYADEFRARVDVAKKTMGDTSPLSDKTRQYVGLAYKLVTGGKQWQVPEELSSAYRQKDIMEQAKKVCQKLVDSALTELKAGRNESSVRELLAFVLMVITPIEA